MAKRKYSVIWERIKVKGNCTVEVHPVIVARVKKAVIKEKNNDVGFKLLNDHDHFFLRITVEETSNKAVSKIKFVLKQSLGLEGIKS